MSEVHEAVIFYYTIVVLAFWNIDIISQIIYLKFGYFRISLTSTINVMWLLTADILLIINFFNDLEKVFIVIVFLKSFKLLRYLDDRLIKNSKYLLFNYQINQVTILVIYIMWASLIGKRQWTNFSNVDIWHYIAMNMFSMKMHREVYDEQNNFMYFDNSIKLLTKLATTESWNEYMFDLMDTESYNNVEWVNNQSWTHFNQNGPMEWGSDYSFYFFMSYYVLIGFGVVNLITALLIDALNQDRNHSGMVIKARDIDIFNVIWCKYDKNTSRTISAWQFVFLIWDLPLSLTCPDTFIEDDENDSLFNKLSLNSIENEETLFSEEYQQKEVMKSLIKKLYVARENETEEIESWEIENETYLLNYNTKSIISEKSALKILKDYDFNECFMDDIRKEQISYNEVSKKLIDKNFKRFNISYKSYNARINRKIDKKWDSHKYTSNIHKIISKIINLMFSRGSKIPDTEGDDLSSIPHQNNKEKLNHKEKIPQNSWGAGLNDSQNSSLPHDSKDEIVRLPFENIEQPLDKIEESKNEEDSQDSSSLSISETYSIVNQEPPLDNNECVVNPNEAIEQDNSSLNDRVEEHEIVIPDIEFLEVQLDDGEAPKIESPKLELSVAILDDIKISFDETPDSGTVLNNTFRKTKEALINKSEVEKNGSWCALSYEKL